MICFELGPEKPEPLEIRQSVKTMSWSYIINGGVS